MHCWPVSPAVAASRTMAGQQARHAPENMHPACSNLGYNSTSLPTKAHDSKVRGLNYFVMKCHGLVFCDRGGRKRASSYVYSACYPPPSSGAAALINQVCLRGRKGTMAIRWLLILETSRTTWTGERAATGLPHSQRSQGKTQALRPRASGQKRCHCPGCTGECSNNMGHVSLMVQSILHQNIT